MSTDPPVLVLRCECGQRMKVPQNAMGKTFKCVRCAKHLTVTAENTEPAGLSTPAAQPPRPSGPPPPTPASKSGKPERVGVLLVEQGVVTQQQVDHALQVQQQKGGKTFELLMELGYLSKESLHSFLSRQPGVAAIDLSRFSIDRELVRLIPRQLALEHNVLPIDRLGKLLTVAMACPLDTATIERMEELTQLKVKAVLCKLDDLHAAVEKYYRDPGEVYTEAAGKTTLGPPAYRSRLDIADAVAAIDALPLHAPACERLRRAAAQRDASMETLLEILAGDPPLAAAVLRLANSAAYGLPNVVDDLAAALILIGRPALAALAGDSAAAALDWLQPLRDRTARVAAIAVALARQSKAVAPGPAYTAGALSTLGAFALAQSAPDKYRTLDQLAAFADLCEAEERLFNKPHPAAGALLAEQWGLPEALCTAIGAVVPKEPAAPLAALVGLARRLADPGAPPDNAALAPYNPAMATLGITPETARACAG